MAEQKLLTDQRGDLYERMEETREERDGVTYIDRRVWMKAPLEFIDITINTTPEAPHD